MKNKPMSIKIELDVDRFLVSSTGEEIVVAEDPQDITSAVELLNRMRQKEDENNGSDSWFLIAEINE